MTIEDKLAEDIIKILAAQIRGPESCTPQHAKALVAFARAIAREHIREIFKLRHAKK